MTTAPPLEELRLSAKIANKVVVGAAVTDKSNVLFIHSEGCKSGVPWRPHCDAQDAIELAVAAGVTVPFGAYLNVSDAVTEMFYKALSTAE